MSMIWPPQSVKMVSTPSALSALATRWPPETTLASALFFFSVSSAVVAFAFPAFTAVSAIWSLPLPAHLAGNWYYYRYYSTIRFVQQAPLAASPIGVGFVPD